MIITTMDDRWGRIYYRIRDHIMSNPDWTKHRPGFGVMDNLEIAFLEHGVRLFKVEDPDINSRWNRVELPDDEELVMFWLRWS